MTRPSNDIHDGAEQKAVTIDDFRRIVWVLSNQSPVRHYLDAKPEPGNIMRPTHIAIEVYETTDAFPRRLNAELQEKGFEMVSGRWFPREEWGNSLFVWRWEALRDWEGK